MGKSCRRTIFARGLAALLAVTSFVHLGRVGASPGDIFEIPAPTIGSDPPKTAELRAGDATVSTQTGALEYRYNIQVPPGRNAMAPSLGLGYSSQGPTYGGIATGWSLPLGLIHDDTSRNWLPTHGPQFVQTPTFDPASDDRFLVGESRLVAVDEPHAADVYKTYRIANGDTSYTRYERLISGASARWRARMTDGSVSYFGEQDHTAGCDVVGDGYAPLTRTIDVFGNEVAYFYESAVAHECRIQKITWGQNANAAMPDPFAQVVFGWDAATTCPSRVFPIGSQLDARSGRFIVTGASKLVSITATAFPPATPGTPDHTRVITLEYSTDAARCDVDHAPVRLLTSIQESAWGTDSPRVDLPAVSFEYGSPEVALTTGGEATLPWSIDAGHSALSWGVRRMNGDDRWPTVEAMMVDLDGDGLLDRLVNASTPGTNGQCRAQWQRNLGPVAGFGTLPVFGGLQTIDLPRLKWRGPNDHSTLGYPLGGSGPADTDEQGENKEGCSLNGQFTAFENSNEAFGLCHDGSSCVNSGDPKNPGPYCYPGGTECPPGGGGGPAHYRSYLAYRWIDADGDGLVDLVAAAHGDIDHYDLEHGNLQAFAGITENPFGPWPACPGTEQDRCKDINSACVGGSQTCPPPTCGLQSCTLHPCTTDWDLMNQCIADAPTIGCNELIRTPFLGPGGGNQNGSGNYSRQPYSRCEGLYPWFIFKNQGNGQFAPTPTIKYQPIPLESDTGDSNASGPTIAAQNHGLLDFDGDGIPDAVLRPNPDNSGTPWWWYVWLGDGTGGFGPTMFVFPGRDKDNNAVSTTGPDQPGPEGRVITTRWLFDANGDGLLDHWKIDPTTGIANAALNDGSSFEISEPSPGAEPIGALNSSITPTSNTDTVITEPDPWAPNQTILAGTTVTHDRAVDVDNDGRVDVVRHDATGQLVVHFNLGGEFIASPVAYSGNPQGVTRIQAAINTVPLGWELRSDLIDLDGDGIAESVFFDARGFHRFERPAAAPPRLLQRVHNGRGAHVLATYGQMHDTSAVEQHPEQTWPDGHPKATPREQWVVKGLTVTDDFAGTTSRTGYHYANPRHAPDDEGRFAFRGFEEVITTSPSLMKTIRRYSYVPDWSGRLEQTQIVPAEAPNDVRSIENSTWTARTLFSGAVTSFYPTLVEHLTCANGQDKNTCTTSPAAYSRSESALVDFPIAGQKLLTLETGTLLKAQSGNVDGDRQTIRTFDMLVDATTYRVRPRTATKEYRTGGVMTMFAKTDQTWDLMTLSSKLTDEVWFDSNDNSRAITRYVTDPQTGNLTERHKPVQNAANTTHTSLVYDPRKLFVAAEINELGHERDYTWEYGTGTKLQTDGPNSRTCTTSCPPPSPTSPVKEQTKIRIDGMGRTIQAFETVSPNGNDYTLYLRESTSYVDAVTATVPSGMTHQVLLDTGATPTITLDHTNLDGHSRPIRKIVSIDGATAVSLCSFQSVCQGQQNTFFAYRDDGTLASVSVPDPSLDDALAMVTYGYAFDSLGRPTSIRRPDTLTPTDQSGADISYDGVTQLTRDFVGIAAGERAATRTVMDSFGRLIEVHEQLTASPDTFAITRYGYGPDDNVTRVVDPEGVTTDLFHDFAGHRSQISRHGRTWQYGYDKNGNVVSEQAPGSTSPLTDPLYTTVIVYDDLDRPDSKLVGQRDLSAADQQLFGGSTEKFVWDQGGNMIGFLHKWKSFRPGNTVPLISRTTKVNDQGLGTLTEHTFDDVAGLTGTRRIHKKYDLAGQLTTTRYYDSVGSDHFTTGTIRYDARGLPKKIVYSDVNSGNPDQEIGAQTRNVAGLVTRRKTETTGPMTFVRSRWTYDALGRVTKQLVEKGPGPITVASQELSYFGNDNPKRLIHAIGDSSKRFVFGYDLRHQIISANETTTSGYFTSSYAYGTAGRFMNARLAQTLSVPGSEIRPRDVRYQYTDSDLERATALIDSVTNKRYATYEYDEAGNQTSRCYGVTTAPCAGENVNFLYDGKNQLRRATKKLAGVVQGIEEYWYADGERVAVVKRDANGSKIEVAWFIQDVEAHYDPTNTLVFTYAHMALGTPLARVRRSAGDTEVEYQFHGLANHTLAAVSSSGITNAAFSYSPFGEVLETIDAGSISGATAHRRRFNDKQQDELVNLEYYGARYYDTISSQWTQSDPLYRFAPDAASTEPRLSSLYTFSKQNSLRYVDPDGKKPLAAHIAENLNNPVVQQAAANAGRSGTQGRVVAVAIVTAVVVAAITASLADEETTSSTVLQWNCGYCTVKKLIDKYDIGYEDALPPPTFGADEPQPDPDKTDKIEPLPPPDEGFPNKPRKPILPDIPPAKQIPQKPWWWPKWVPYGPKKQGVLDESSTCKVSKTAKNYFKAKPADTNGDGTVTDEEESTWMKSLQ